MCENERETLRLKKINARGPEQGVSFGRGVLNERSPEGSFGGVVPNGGSFGRGGGRKDGSGAGFGGGVPNRGPCSGEGPRNDGQNVNFQFMLFWFPDQKNYIDFVKMMDLK